MAFYVASSQEFDEVTPNGGCRTIEAGSARQRFRCNTAAEVIESAVDSRFGECGKDLVAMSGVRLISYLYLRAG